MESEYKSRDEAYMRSLHARIEGLSVSLESAISSWAYFKKQVLLSDLYTYACTVLSYKPMFIPCEHVTPDVLFITQTEHQDELRLYARVEQSMQTVTGNIYRTSLWKSERQGADSDTHNATIVLASEIEILQPKAIFIFGQTIFQCLNGVMAVSAFVTPPLIDSPNCLKEVNAKLQQLVNYIFTMKG